MMERLPEFVEARKAFHAELLTSTLTINSAGVVSNADGNNRASVLIAKGIADLLKAETQGERIAGQTSGNQFEGACARFVRTTFLKLGHLRPGIWDVHQVSGRDPELAAAIGSDYTNTPSGRIRRALALHALR